MIEYFNKKTEAASLAVFRILFGALMFISLVRFWYNGWIEKLYISPQFHFHYLGFDFVKVPGIYTYALFVLCALAAILVCIGYKYRPAIILFFLSFTYIELMEKASYLNHYYFISILSFILIWLPAHQYYSIDSKNNPKLCSQFIPKWNVDIIKLTLAIVYIYAGLAKLNWDWMFNAMPLSIWLSSKTDLPLLGSLMHEKWLHYLFSWFGAVYDLFIVFFLIWKRTRVAAFVMVVVFHILTRILFPIGMFPYIMILSTLIFFDASFHHKLLERVSSIFQINKSLFDNGNFGVQSLFDRIGKRVLLVLIVFQLVIPLRFLAYPGNVFWTEQGYRFSWRVMLMEKTGHANFKIVNSETGKRFYVQNDDFLTAFQEKQMSTQADCIVEYGQFLGKHFESQGHENVSVFVESYASLNGRKSQPYIDPEVDLLKIKNSLFNKPYILPLND